MRPGTLGEAYHIERALAAHRGLHRYLCGCEKCHGFKMQTVQVVQRHHRKFGRDRNLPEPLLGNDRRPAQPPQDVPPQDVPPQDVPPHEDELDDDEEYVDTYNYENFEEAPAEPEVLVEEMVQNYFARADEIHQQLRDDDEAVVDFEDLSSDDEEDDHTDILAELLGQATEPLFDGSSTTRLQFSIILMSLCTLFSVSHHCLDEILTFLKHDVLPSNNNCPKNSYEMKTLLMKLGLSHESIHCCDCGRTLYWQENAELDKCPHCKKSRYITGSQTVPVRVLRYFSVIKRLRRLFRCPSLANHLRWHSSNHSNDGKIRSVVDSEQWRFIEDKYPNFSSEGRNIRMGLALDGVNPYSLQSSKHSVWPVLMVLYNLPPYLVTKRFFISLTMIIPGPNSPSEHTIDTFLQPLVHDLKNLWRGVPAVDMSAQPGTSRLFKLRTILMWTIHDFPAYTLISGQAGKGYAGCPICGECTVAEHSAAADKTVYLGHRRWLRPNHRWRDAKAAFNGKTNHDPPPERQSGLTTVQRGGWRESFLQLGGCPNSRADPVKKTGVKRISILYQLPYWQDLPIRHVLDPMHCEKNICDILLRILLGETDGPKSQEDLQSRGIRSHLHLQANNDGTTFFMPDAPYVLSREERQRFLSTMKELKFPTNYVANLSNRIQDGKLRGMKTHDYHILLQQVLPLCLRDVGDEKVVGAIVRVSRLFRRIFAKVVDVSQKAQMLEDVAETICTLEKELPPSVFVIMLHLTIHLVEELFICGPVQTRSMYPFERFMKGLKGFVKNKAKPEGSMAYGYLREESIGFMNEYLSEYTATRKRAWDDEEEPTMNDEILEGVKRDRLMTPEFQKLIHNFVLDNTEHMEPYRRRYADCVMQRQQERDNYRRQYRRGGRRQRFAYPGELAQLPDFAKWVLEEVRTERRSGVLVEKDIMDTARGPLPVAGSFRSMYAYGNHFRVLSSEHSLKTADSGVAATFRQVCRNGIRDNNQVTADVEYVGHIEEILELDYRRHSLVVLVCDFVKANYNGDNATIKKDKWGFTLANYRRTYGNICRDSFAFPIHCEQVFYSEASQAPSWRVVLRKEVRGRRVLPNHVEEEDAELFQMGEDEDFEGLRPEREVGEEQVLAARTGEDVVLEPTRRPRRRLVNGPAGVTNQRGHGRGGRRGRRGGRAQRGSPALEGENGPISDDNDERHEDETLYRNNLGSASGEAGSSRGQVRIPDQRRVRQRLESQDLEDPEVELSRERSRSMTCTSSSSNTSEFSNNNEGVDAD